MNVELKVKEFEKVSVILNGYKNLLKKLMDEHEDIMRGEVDYNEQVSKPTMVHKPTKKTNRITQEVYKFCVILHSSSTVYRKNYKFEQVKNYNRVHVIKNEISLEYQSGNDFNIIRIDLKEITDYKPVEGDHDGLVLLKEKILNEVKEIREMIVIVEEKLYMKDRLEQLDKFANWL